MTTNPHHIFLEKLRRSGQTNMFGAIPYIVKEFGCTYDEASDILCNWMATYKQSDYEGMFTKNRPEQEEINYDNQINTNP